MQITKERNIYILPKMLKKRKVQRITTHLSADKICLHHRFHASSGNFLTFLLVRFRNCFNEPEDMYSVINITLGLSLCVSVQYRWNFTIFGCSNCVKLSNTCWIFSSCALKFFRSENWTSFHTTSTPSSVSIAKWDPSMPGTSRCSTYTIRATNK